MRTPAQSQPERPPWFFGSGIDAGGWARMDVAAVVQVLAPPRVPEDPNDPRRDWPVAVLSTYSGGLGPNRLKVRGSWGVPDGWLDYPCTYLVLGAMPKAGKDAPLFSDQDMMLLDPAAAGHARVYWALPFRGTLPRTGGTKEEWFGRAILAALEGDPKLCDQGLAEFVRGSVPDDRYRRTGSAIFGLTGYDASELPGYWAPGEFSRGLAAWAAKHGPKERLFAGWAMEALGVSGSSSYYHRSLLEYAATDADPPPWDSAPFPMGWAARLTEEEVRLQAPPLPTAEEWVSTIVRLKNPKAQEMLLSCRTGGEEIGLEHLRRLSALLDSPIPRVRWLLCDYYWGRFDLTSMTEAEAEPNRPLERSPENRIGPPDYPRLDEHVLRWKQYFR
ncbi:MAG: hypothetical protein IT207_01685 [Fimbriimonadaceae bacterium]|nr:hypothetical protein [Fimbriimonadaceae bacterium]